MSIKTLPPSDFTEEEVEQIVIDLLALKKAQISEFLSRNNLPKSGTKDAIRERVDASLRDETLAPARIIEFLDEVVPWGKQHVFLYKGPRKPITDWKNTDWLRARLGEHRVAKYLNASLPLALPESMKLSSILHDGNRLRVTAIKKRDWWERNPDLDDAKQTEDGDKVEMRAFIHRVTRSLVAFEWDLLANIAFLQICQLPSGADYDECADEFFTLIGDWLDIGNFQKVDLRPSIKKLHELEEARKAETRSHGIHYRTLQGRRFEGRSASPSDSLLGEASIDSAMRAIRKTGVGHLGNFYWLANVGPGSPLESELHVIIVGAKTRVNFPTPNTEQAVRYVLSRIRSHSP